MLHDENQHQHLPQSRITPAKARGPISTAALAALVVVVAGLTVVLVVALVR